MMRGPLSGEICHACGRGVSEGLLAEYEGVPFGRLCIACAPSPAVRYRFLGAVFNAFPHDDGLLTLSIRADTPLPKDVRRLPEQAIREIAMMRGLTGRREEAG
jgi:hypothetical protein